MFPETLLPLIDTSPKPHFSPWAISISKKLNMIIHRSLSVTAYPGTWGHHGYWSWSQLPLAKGTVTPWTSCPDCVIVVLWFYWCWLKSNSAETYFAPQSHVRFCRVMWGFFSHDMFPSFLLYLLWSERSLHNLNPRILLETSVSASQTLWSKTSLCLRPCFSSHKLDSVALWCRAGCLPSHLSCINEGSPCCVDRPTAQTQAKTADSDPGQTEEDVSLGKTRLPRLWRLFFVCRCTEIKLAAAAAASLLVSWQQMLPSLMWLIPLKKTNCFHPTVNSSPPFFASQCSRFISSLFISTKPLHNSCLPVANLTGSNGSPELFRTVAHPSNYRMLNDKKGQKALTLQPDGLLSKVQLWCFSFRLFYGS